MFAACTYEEVEMIEREIENNEIVVLLFVKSTEKSILEEFEYIHVNSGKYCSIYAVGYSDDPAKSTDPAFKPVDVSVRGQWYYSTTAFVDFKNKLEQRIQWKYSGETELIILQNNPGARCVLDFRNYVSIDVNKGIREGYIDSFQRFMESLVRISRSKVTAKEASNALVNSRISVKDALADAITECKKIPKPVQKILKDNLFYRSYCSYRV